MKHERMIRQSHFRSASVWRSAVSLLGRHSNWETTWIYQIQVNWEKEVDG